MTRNDDIASGLSADQPIRRPAEDLLDRSRLVELLKDEIQNAPTSDGFVMALTAPGERARPQS